MKWSKPGHEYDEIGNSLKDIKDVYLWGVGGYAKEILTVFQSRPQYFPWDIHLIDSSRPKQMQDFMGYQVLSPESFFAVRKENYFVIDCPEGRAGKEIHKALLDNGVPEQLIFDGDYFLFNYLPIYFAYVQDMTFFTSESILCSTVCNLNCRDCLNFTPYLKTAVTDDLDSLKKDVDLFFRAVDLVYRFQVTGGEPLLYKDLIPFITYIRQNYGEKILRLEMVTNGTIVPSDEICQSLLELNVFVFLDDYRLSVPNSSAAYKEVRSKMDKYGIRYQDNYVEKWIIMFPAGENCAKGMDNFPEKFAACHNPWSTLRHGKISACNYGAYAAKAGICEDEPDEYFDLQSYTPDRRKELIEFRTGFTNRGYVNFCKECGGWTSINHNYSWSAIQEPKS